MASSTPRIRQQASNTPRPDSTVTVGALRTAPGGSAAILISVQAAEIGRDEGGLVAAHSARPALQWKPEPARVASSSRHGALGGWWRRCPWRSWRSAPTWRTGANCPQRMTSARLYRQSVSRTPWPPHQA